MSGGSDHAESPTSPLLSSVLVTSHDAITGYWGPAQLDPAAVRALFDALDTQEGYLHHVQPYMRARIGTAQLCNLLLVKGDRKSASATLKVSDKTITTIARPNPGYFIRDLDWVRAYADLRSDRLSEIQVQITDIMSFFGALRFLDRGRRQGTLLLLNVVRDTAIYVESLVKYYCRAPRPIDYLQQVQPMIQTPDHSAFPSGHATEAFAVATVLNRLATGNGPKTGIAAAAFPFRLAHRIAANRTVAGVHFPVDSHAGAWLGCYIGEAVHAIATGGQLSKEDFALPDHEVAGGSDEAHQDADIAVPQATIDFLLTTLTVFPSASTTAYETITSNPIIKRLWDDAQAEWPSPPILGPGGV